MTLPVRHCAATPCERPSAKSAKSASVPFVRMLAWLVVAWLQGLCVKQVVDILEGTGSFCWYVVV